MHIKTRKLLGVLATLLFLVAYSLIAMAIGGQFVTGQGKLVELLYFILAGIGWVPVAMLIVRWMSRGSEG